MATFVLKKYQPEEEKANSPETTDPAKTDETKTDEPIILIEATDTVAEIVAKALQASFTNVEIDKTNNKTTTTGTIANTTDPSKTTDINATYKASIIATEDINKDPVSTFNRLGKDNHVHILTKKAFGTAKEEWFLTNLSNKTSNVYYSLESLLDKVASTLGVERKC